MKPLIIDELPYAPDSAPLFAKFLDCELPVYLDSCAPYSARGRYDIFSANPITTITTDPYSSLNTDSYNNNIKYFEKIKEAINTHTPEIHNDYHLPFIGGALGYFGYDLGRQLEQLPQTIEGDLSLPDACVGIYSWAVVVDHRQQRTLLVCHPCADPALLSDVQRRLATAEPINDSHFTLQSSFSANLSREQYAEAFERIQRYIRAGDCYQINLAQRFSASYQGNPWEAYQRLRPAAAAPYSAYMQCGQHSILSVSPERFLHVSNQRATTSPIKGTIARGSDRASDEALAQQLLNSPKDRAENLMIVDLLRNDLGKSCIPGSIQVDQLFELQRFETVHHLVSTITGQLREDQHALDLLAACFPGGSITGAPKVRAMQIIEELEPHRRSAYCGSIGYISCDGQMDTNIAIRTLICDAEDIHCWAGGGIVADSECASEYQECHTKVDKLLAALEPVSTDN